MVDEESKGEVCEASAGTPLLSGGEMKRLLFMIDEWLLVAAVIAMAYGLFRIWRAVRYEKREGKKRV